VGTAVAVSAGGATLTPGLLLAQEVKRTDRRMEASSEGNIFIVKSPLRIVITFVVIKDDISYEEHKK
jgi:hypothetical protein